MDYSNVIETRYDGILFRSRTEARWAVFFDALKVDWQYEPEGYLLGNGDVYLPDFYVKEFGGGGFFEVKPDVEIEPSWMRKLEGLQKVTGEKCFLLNGPPDFKFYLMVHPAEWSCDCEPLAECECIQEELGYVPNWCSIGFCGGDGNYCCKGGYWIDPVGFDLIMDYFDGDKKDARSFFWDEYQTAVLKSKSYRF